jgi:hypothetical protein
VAEWAEVDEGACGSATCLVRDRFSDEALAPLIEAG